MSVDSIQKTCITKRQMLKTCLRLLSINFFKHKVGKNAAALAYYLLFALFPLLIFITNLVGLLNLDVHSITGALHQMLPHDIVGIIETYLDYVTNTSSHILLWFSLIFSIWFPLRAVQGLMDDVRRAYHLSKPQRPMTYIIKQLIYTVIFLIVIVLTLVLSIMGQRVLSYINQLIPSGSFKISGYLLNIWQYLRFLPIAVLMIVAIGALYSAALDKKPPIKTILPGIIAALLSWMIVSIGFSFYIENFAHYSLIYGTLGAVIILLTWLYMTAVILILGAELNAILLNIRSDDKLKSRD